MTEALAVIWVWQRQIQLVSTGLLVARASPAALAGSSLHEIYPQEDYSLPQGGLISFPAVAVSAISCDLVLKTAVPQ